MTLIFQMDRFILSNLVSTDIDPQNYAQYHGIAQDAVRV